MYKIRLINGEDKLIANDYNTFPLLQLEPKQKIKLPAILLVLVIVQILKLYEVNTQEMKIFL